MDENEIPETAPAVPEEIPAPLLWAEASDTQKLDILKRDLDALHAKVDWLGTVTQEAILPTLSKVNTLLDMADKMSKGPMGPMLMKRMGGGV